MGRVPELLINSKKASTYPVFVGNVDRFLCLRFSITHTHDLIMDAFTILGVNTISRRILKVLDFIIGHSFNKIIVCAYNRILNRYSYLVKYTLHSIFRRINKKSPALALDY